MGGYLPKNARLSAWLMAAGITIEGYGYVPVRTKPSESDDYMGIAYDKNGDPWRMYITSTGQAFAIPTT